MRVVRSVRSALGTATQALVGDRLPFQHLSFRPSADVAPRGHKHTVGANRENAGTPPVGASHGRGGSEKEAADVYWHACGLRYHRMSEPTPPRHCMVICERCLEPMPVCDSNRATFTYRAIEEPIFARLVLPIVRTAGTKRPMLRRASVTHLNAHAP